MGGLDVRMRQVGCRHGRVDAVRDVDLDIAAGEHVALTGTNGSGKTTLLRALLGLHRAVDGEIGVGGRQARTAAEWAWRRRACAWIPQKPAAGRFPLLAGELLASSGARGGGSGRGREAGRGAADRAAAAHPVRRAVAAYVSGPGGRLRRRRGRGAAGRRAHRRARLRRVRRRRPTCCFAAGDLGRGDARPGARRPLRAGPRDGRRAGCGRSG